MATVVHKIEDKMSTTNQEERDVTARWNHREEKIFIQLMDEEVKKGNRSTTTFSKKAWNDIREKFYIQTGLRYKHQQFKNKFNKLRQHFREFKKLRDVPMGFGWNPITKTVVASDEIWDSYIKKNPNARHFRNKGCPMFDELMTIYGDTTANGGNAGACTQGALDAGDDEANINVDVNNDVINLDSVPLTSYEEVAEDINGDADVEDGVQSMRSRSRTPTSCRGSESLNEAFADACRAFTLIQQRKYISPSLNAKDDPYSIRRCCELLSAVDDVNDDLYVKALRMFQDNGWRETFVSVPAEKRLLLLKSLE